MKLLAQASIAFVIAACIVLLLTIWSTQPSNGAERLSRSDLNAMLKEHQKTHYIDYQAMFCHVTYFIKPEKWMLKCTFTGEGALVKKFECPHCEVLG